MEDVKARLATLEAAVAELQRAARSTESAPREARSPASRDEFWMLQGLQNQQPDGAVAFAGHVDLPAGPVRWQWGRPTDALLDSDWEDAATPLAALGHPIRLHLLRLILTGTTSTAQLSETEGFGTSGQLHHHLRTLTAAGWLSSAGRGQYQVPPQRVIPLLTILAASDAV